MVRKDDVKQGLLDRVLWCHLWADKGVGLSPVINFCREGFGDQFTNLCPAFRQMKGGQKSFFFVSVSSQLPSAQNNP